MKSNIIVGIVAFGLGAVAGALFTRKKLEEECDRVIQAEIEDYKRVRERMDKHPRRVKKEEPSEEETYEEIASEYDGEEEDDDGDASYVVPIKPDLGAVPYIICADDFYNGKPHYDKTTLTYYDGDDTLVDDSEEVITDVEYYIGGEALSRFGEDEAEPDIVYVRNDKISTDFEVVRAYAKFEPTVIEE